MGAVAAPLSPSACTALPAGSAGQRFTFLPLQCLEEGQHMGTGVPQQRYCACTRARAATSECAHAATPVCTCACCNTCVCVHAAMCVHVRACCNVRACPCMLQRVRVRTSACCNVCARTSACCSTPVRRGPSPRHALACSRRRAPASPSLPPRPPRAAPALHPADGVCWGIAGARAARRRGAAASLTKLN